MGPITEEAVAERSYRIWEREGRPDGRHLEHWYRARAELETEAAQTQSSGKKPRAAAGVAGTSQSEQFLRILRAG